MTRSTLWHKASTWRYTFHPKHDAAVAVATKHSLKSPLGGPSRLKPWTCQPVPLLFLPLQTNDSSLRSTDTRWLSETRVFCQCFIFFCLNTDRVALSAVFVFRPLVVVNTFCPVEFIVTIAVHQTSMDSWWQTGRRGTALTSGNQRTFFWARTHTRSFSQIDWD